MVSGREADAVVVGSGVNGLSAAAMLARSGREVVVLERSEGIGGSVCTDELTLPGFRHDVFAMSMGAFAGGPVNAELGAELREHGLEFVSTSRPFCSVFPDGTHIGVSTAPEETIASIARVCQDDAERWRELGDYFNRIAPAVAPLIVCRRAETPGLAVLRLEF